jgi:hypothetical protein
MFEAEVASVRDPEAARLAGDDEEQGTREVEKLLRKRRLLGLDRRGRARWERKRRRDAELAADDDVDSLTSSSDSKSSSSAKDDSAGGSEIDRTSRRSRAQRL